MGLNIRAGFSAAFNPNLNPLPVVRPYTGITTGLLAAYHLDYNPSPELPVAGSETDDGIFSGAPRQGVRGIAFSNNDLLDSGAVPGSAIPGLTLYAVARRTGVVPSGASATAGLVCVGAPNNAKFRLDLLVDRPIFNTAVTQPQAFPLLGPGDVSMFDFYAASISETGAKLYRPRITTSPVVTAATISGEGASNLDYSFRIGTGGTAVKWAESEVMAAGVFTRQLSDGEVLDQYAAMQAYAASLGVVI